MNERESLFAATTSMQLPCDRRALDRAREGAQEALSEYAYLLHGWNRPDDEHTRHQLRRMVDDVIKEEFNDV